MRKTCSGIVMAVLIGALALPGSPAQATPAAAVPAITIEGTAPFADGQTVTVHGSGLTPGEELFVEECESAGICNVRVGGPQVVASDGTVAMTATLTRYFLDFFSNYGDAPVDCSIDSCRLGLVAIDPDVTDGYRVEASSLIAFDSTSAWHPRFRWLPLAASRRSRPCTSPAKASRPRAARWLGSARRSAAGMTYSGHRPRPAISISRCRSHESASSGTASRTNVRCRCSTAGRSSSPRRASRSTPVRSRLSPNSP